MRIEMRGEGTKMKTTLRNVNEVALMFFLRCFSVFIVNFEQVNVCRDNCCIAESFKTYLTEDFKG